MESRGIDTRCPFGEVQAIAYSGIYIQQQPASVFYIHCCTKVLKKGA